MPLNGGKKILAAASSLELKSIACARGESA
jgi:hypothetical protein